MATPTPQQTATGQSVVIANAPPAYSEKQSLGEGQPPVQQQTDQHPQVQVSALQPTWPQGYPVSYCCILENLES